MKITDQPEFGALIDMIFAMYDHCAHDLSRRSVVAAGDDEHKYIMMLFRGNGEDVMAVKKFLEERDK